MTALRKQPVTCVLIALCCYVWNTLRARRWGWEEVGSSYRNVMFEGQVGIVDVCKGEAGRVRERRSEMTPLRQL